MAEKSNHWTIVAVSDSGDEVSIPAHPEEKLKTLLVKATHALYGENAEPDKYELLIGGVKADNLEATLEQAGLHSGSEVVVQIIDVHRG